MTGRAIRWAWGAAALALGLAGRAAPAAASGFASAFFGGEHGSVVATNPTALYYNPGALGFSEGNHLFGDGILALRHVTWEHAQAAGELPEPPGAEGSQYGTARLFNVFAGPTAAWTSRFGNLAVGLGLFVPFGGRARWSQNQRFVGDPNFPLAADGVQRWSGIDGALTFIYVPAGVAYRFGRLSVGVAGNLIRSSISTTQAKNPLGGGDPDVTHEGRATLDVSGWQGSFALGAMLEAVRERLWLGLSYQAQPGLGPMAMDGTLRTDYQGGSTTVPVTLHQALPDIVRLGARLRASPVLELRLWGAYTRWSVMQTQCVGLAGGDCAVDTTGADATANGNTIQNLRRRWHDTVAVHAGASRWVGPRTELFAGATFETAAIPDETLDPGLPDANNILATLGARMALRPRLHAALSYAHIQYWNRDNTGRSQLLDAQPPTRRADGGGRYTQWVGLVDLNVDVEF